MHTCTHTHTHTHTHNTHTHHTHNTHTHSEEDETLGGLYEAPIPIPPRPDFRMRKVESPTHAPKRMSSAIGMRHWCTSFC